MESVISITTVERIFNEMEKWAPIPGYEGYYDASDQGRIRSCQRIVMGPRQKLYMLECRVLQQRGHYRGYMRVDLHKEGKRRTTFVHYAVASAFFGAKDQAEFVVDHKDRDKSNNRLANLEWTTWSGNTRRHYERKKEDDNF